ncbi:MAG: hypothetical protein ACREH8_12300 [Opitutaceae bacterium]
MLQRLLLAVAAAFCLIPVHAATLTVRDRVLLIDGQPAKLWGIRVASASQTPDLTDQLVAQLDDYRAHGVNTVAVYYMGSLGLHGDPFSPDGHAIDRDHQARMDAIIRALDDRGMVAIVGIFYQRTVKASLRDWAAAQNAVRTVAIALQPHRNIVLNIANEQNTSHYQNLPWGRVREPAALIELCRIAKAADPRRIVGAGGYNHANNEIIGRAREVDVLLFDGNKIESNALLRDRFHAAGVLKPIINVELFGGWTKQFQPPGVYPDSAREAHFRAIDEAAQFDDYHICFHSSPWCQGTAEPKQPMRFDLGGPGTRESPGIRWYFDYLREKTRR